MLYIIPQNLPNPFKGSPDWVRPTEEDLEVTCAIWQPNRKPDICRSLPHSRAGHMKAWVIGGFRILPYIHNLRNNMVEPGWVAQLEHPVHQKVVGLILGQGTYLGCRLDPRLEHVGNNQSMFLPSQNQTYPWVKVKFPTFTK